MLRAPAQGGPFLITRQPFPELISSLRADAQASRRLGWGLAALAVCLLAAAAVAGPPAGHSSGGGSEGGGSLRKGVVQLGTEMRERVLSTLAPRRGRGTAAEHSRGE